MASPNALDNLLMQTAVLPNAAGPLAQNTPMAWTGRVRGYQPNEVEGDAIKQRARKARSAQPVPADQAALVWYEWSDAERDKWIDLLIQHGLMDEDERDDWLKARGFWEDAVNESANFFAVGKKITPEQVVGLIADPAAAERRRKAKSQQSFTGTKTDSSTQVRLTDPTTARALVNQTLSNQLGRAATDEEIREFTRVLNNAEQANPLVTATTSQFQDGEITSQSSTTTGGIDEGEVLTQKAMATPEYGSYQSATTYFNALLQAIQAPT